VEKYAEKYANNNVKYKKYEIKYSNKYAKQCAGIYIEYDRGKGGRGS
jgi:hypothetical protein